MKVGEILARVLVKVEEMEDSDTHLMVRDSLPNSIIRSEEILTLFDLRDLYNSTDLELDITNYKRLKRKEVFEPFKVFLAQRWERLKDYPQLHYTQTFNTPITKVCELLAVAIADLKIFLHKKNSRAPSTFREPLHRFELLMPDNNFLNLVTTLNLNQQDEEEKLELHHFILDEEFKIIHIKDCLTDASNDLSFKHTSFLHAIGTPQRLSKANYLRVRLHSKAANNAWDTINKIEGHIASINTVGGALRRLMTALHNAGICGNLGGSDEDASRDVYLGIKLFYDYFTSLHANVQKAVYELKASEELSGLFEFIFKKLLLMAHYDNQVNALFLRDYDIETTAYLSEAEVDDLSNYVETIADTRHLSLHHTEGEQDLSFSCVDQMSLTIGKILKLGSNILNLTPATTEVAIGLLFADHRLDPELTKLKVQLNAFLRAAAKPATERYTKEDVLKSSEKKALYFTDNNQFLKTFSRKFISTPAHLFQCLNYLRCEYHRDFIVEYVRTRALSKLFVDAGSLIQNYKLLKLGNKKQNETTLDVIVTQLSAMKLKKLFPTQIELTLLSKEVSFNLFLNILQNWLSFIFVNAMFKNSDEIRRFMSPFTEPQRLSLCSFFNILYLPAFFSSAPSSPEPKRSSIFVSSSKWLKSRFFPASEDEKKEEHANKRQRLETSTEEDDADMEVVRPVAWPARPR
jgi:hypothetical protein